jgi:hypothetical protein
LSKDEQHHVALPKLYGQPAYARPPRVFSSTERPPDVDDLPLAVDQTDEERELAAALEDGGAPVHRNGTSGESHRPQLHPRPFSLKTIGRLFGSRD